MPESEFDIIPPEALPADTEAVEDPQMRRILVGMFQIFRQAAQDFSEPTLPEEAAEQNNALANLNHLYMSGMRFLYRLGGGDPDDPSVDRRTFLGRTGGGAMKTAAAVAATTGVGSLVIDTFIPAHTVEAQEAPIPYGYSNVVPDVSATQSERTALAALRGDITPGVRMPIPLANQPTFEVNTATGAIENLTGFPLLPEPDSNLAQLLTGTRRAEFTIPGFTDGTATVPVRNMLELMQQINTQNTALWQERTGENTTPDRFASLALKAKDNDSGTATSVTAEVVVGAQPVTLVITRNGEPSRLNFTPGSRLTLNPEDGTFRYIKASMAADTAADTVDVNPPLHTALGAVTLADGRRISIDAPEGSPALIERTSGNTLRAIVIGGNNEGIGSLNTQVVRTTVDADTRFRSTPDRSGGDGNVQGTYTAAQGETPSPQQHVLAADFMGSDAYWQLRREWPGLGVDEHGLIRVTREEYDEGNPDRYWHLFTTPSGQTDNQGRIIRNYIWIRSDKVRVNPNPVVNQEIPTPVAVAMAPELSAAGALGAAYTRERIFGGDTVYKIAFNQGQIYEPVLSDPDIAARMSIPISNLEWRNIQREMMNLGNGQEMPIPLQRWGYLLFGNNIIAVVPALITDVVRRPYAGRGGVGDRVVIMKIPTERGTVAMAKPLDHQIFISSQQTQGDDDLLITPTPAFMEQILTSTEQNPVSFDAVFRTVINFNNANPGGFIGEERVQLWEQRARERRILLLGILLRSSDGWENQNLRQIANNQPPQSPDMEITTNSINIPSYFTIQQ